MIGQWNEWKNKTKHNITPHTSNKMRHIFTHYSFAMCLCLGCSVFVARATHTHTLLHLHKWQTQFSSATWWNSKCGLIDLHYGYEDWFDDFKTCVAVQMMWCSMCVLLNTYHSHFLFGHSILYWNLFYKKNRLQTRAIHLIM